MRVINKHIVSYNEELVQERKPTKLFIFHPTEPTMFFKM